MVGQTVQSIGWVHLQRGFNYKRETTAVAGHITIGLGPVESPGGIFMHGTQVGNLTTLTPSKRITLSLRKLPEGLPARHFKRDGYHSSWSAHEIPYMKSGGEGKKSAPGERQFLRPNKSPP